ncbi:hypothetical protein BCR37DRAFT_4482 [Protomyces lactucae-debilis]|uniref:Uncharacterized protein n=1 Tax=Protomyces lactucae-debilis TaxID=2754530 RepID=A0A1Y2FWV4_PROLT|nr:uncharacterized protein BCR37DRAFT_4482 [Protomyces lactucae-debilis]ORY87666.1 hypothetical protein BCR37DRAFT_4482 [Protomyces lactucae-debilis]
MPEQGQHHRACRIFWHNSGRFGRHRWHAGISPCSSFWPIRRHNASCTSVSVALRLCKYCTRYGVPCLVACFQIGSSTWH